MTELLNDPEVRGALTTFGLIVFVCIAALVAEVRERRRIRRSQIRIAERMARIEAKREARAAAARRGGVA